MGNRIAAPLIRGIREIRGLGLGNGISPRAAWGHAAFNRKFPEASCQIAEETVWELATGDWDLNLRRVGARGLQQGVSRY